MDHLGETDQKISNPLKWYWRINYFITSYLTIIFIITFVISLFNFTKIPFQLIKILTVDSLLIYPINIFIDCIQILAIVLVLIFKKSERTKWHYWYLVLVIILSIIKIIGVLAILFFGFPTVVET